MIDYPIDSKYKKWDGLCQICTVAGNASVIEEHTRFTRFLGGKIVGVHGIWPKLRFWGGEGSSPSPHVVPTHQLDNVQEKCVELGVDFIQCQKFMFSGDHYNMAIDHLKENAEDAKVVLWLEGDVCLNMDYFDWYIDTVNQLKEDGYDGLIIRDQIELGTNRKYLLSGAVNQGFFFNNGLFSTRSGGFDGHHRFTTNTLKLAIASDLNIPSIANLIHLHIFKEHGSCRIENDIWCCAGLSLSFDKDIGDSSYLNFIYDNLEIVCANLSRKMDGYIGEEIYQQRID